MKGNKLKERNFIEILKKLLWLVPFRKIAYTKYCVKSLCIWADWVVHVFFLAKITGLLELSKVHEFNNVLLIYGIYILSFEILNFIMRKWWWMETLPMWKNDILQTYLRKYIQLDNNIIESIWVGKMINTIDQWIRQWTQSVAELIEKGSMLMVSFAFTLYMISKVDITYAFIFLLLLFVFVAAGNYSNKKLWEFRKVRYSLIGDRLKLLVKVLMSKIEILSNGKIQLELEKDRTFWEMLFKVNTDMSLHRTILRRFSQFCMSIILLTSFWYLWNQYLLGEVSLSIVVWLTGTLIIMQKAISEMINFYVTFTKQYVAIDRFWDFFDSTPEITWYNTWKAFDYNIWNIEIKNMTFWYDKGNTVFTDFNINIPGGAVTAFVWNSWSGKTTLVKIISWYLRHDSWDVIIDGQKNKEVSLKSLYKHVGYLTQEPSVFDWTIRENLMYWVSSGQAQDLPVQSNQDCRDTPCGYPDLERIITLSKCEFIYDFEKWLDTEIWEKWIRLSWGQRQRLAIAKIFLKNPEIIILDEPTSALDSFSEEQITKAMHNLFKDRTVIIIAHRLQTVKNADNIFVLENGKVVEEWNHKELVKQEWIYKKMLDLQSGF